MPKRVAVIGAGACGLIAVKCCRDEGLEVTCYEMTSDLGGLWRYTEAEEEKSCVMKSTSINTSKELMAFSDFPPPDDFPNFMHHTRVLAYFRLYAEKFDVERHVKYRHQVEHVTPADNYEQTGAWHVRVRNLASGDVTNHVFDGVLVCTGHHADKHVPSFEGLDQFTGPVLHTKEYKRPAGYEDKRVLVVGLGNSGGDVAVELSRTAQQVYLAVRTGSYCLSRVGARGWPLDSLYVTRAFTAANRLVPHALLLPYLRRVIDERMDHEMYGLLPKHEPMQNHPLVNDSLPNCLLGGSITLKPNVRRFYEGGVEFDDGTRAELDAVVLATGYVFGFPFLDSSTIEVKENKVDLYKYMYPPDLPHPTLAVIGCFQPIGSVNPIAEMQCRLASRVIKGLVKLPAAPEMWRDVREKACAMARQYYASQRHTLEVDLIPFMDELAALVGCRPSFGQLCRLSPSLALKCFFGMWTPYQYRLLGPGTWSGARGAIETLEERIRKPLRTRMPEGRRRGSGGLVTLALVLFLPYLLYQVLNSWLLT